jgi:molybdopterin-guanine dinucleotide biosynthesis protein A
MSGSNPPPMSAIVLAGGASTRMGGVDKMLVEIDGVPLIQRVLRVITGLFGDVVVAAGRPGRFDDLEGVRLVPDAVHGIGPIAGLRAGLLACANPWAFVVAADLPYLDGDLVRRVAAQAGDGQFNAVVPRYQDRREPLHAAYHRRIVGAIDELVANGDSKILHLLDRQPVRYLELAEHELEHLVNVNRPADLARRNIP